MTLRSKPSFFHLRRVVLLPPNEDHALVPSRLSLLPSSSEARHTRQPFTLTSSLSSAQNQLKAQNLIIEGAHAQLVVQDMILNKQNQTLEAKGKKKNNDRTILFPGGYSRCLTSDEFTALVDAQAAALDKKAEEKRKRAELRQQKRSRKDLVDSRWREAQEKYRDLKAKHEEQCRALLAAGTRKRDLPPGPERVYKKDIEAEIDDMLSGDGSEEEMSEEDE
ncbi:hypothetical protein BKA70DRAFT_343884 [Coprinopsis sp. MPI-PUGE-AT-0042]|nr:hypothetical protein BKA70DRAFT_343884 [Coprinopsis sp. MPI-PUGE-AT-0042]